VVTGETFGIFLGPHGNHRQRRLSVITGFGRLQVVGNGTCIELRFALSHWAVSLVAVGMIGSLRGVVAMSIGGDIGPFGTTSVVKWEQLRLWPRFFS